MTWLNSFVTNDWAFVFSSAALSLSVLSGDFAVATTIIFLLSSTLFSVLRVVKYAQPKLTGKKVTKVCDGDEEWGIS